MEVIRNLRECFSKQNSLQRITDWICKESVYGDTWIQQKSLWFCFKDGLWNRYSRCLRVPEGLARITKFSKNYINDDISDYETN